MAIPAFLLPSTRQSSINPSEALMIMPRARLLRMVQRPDGEAAADLVGIRHLPAIGGFHRVIECHHDILDRGQVPVIPQVGRRNLPRRPRSRTNGKNSRLLHERTGPDPSGGGDPPPNSRNGPHAQIQAAPCALRPGRNLRETRCRRHSNPQRSSPPRSGRCRIRRLFRPSALLDESGSSVASAGPRPIG